MKESKKQWDNREELTVERTKCHMIFILTILKRIFYVERRKFEFDSVIN